ncbi:MAG: 3-hydroxybutyryl-CoA dehydrogenase, partial [Panacagrimonas sp.]
VHDDEQMKRNAAYVRTRFVDHGKLGLQTGEGYYQYPEPAYRSEKFLQVPDRSCVADIVERSFLGA